MTHYTEKPITVSRGGYIESSHDVRVAVVSANGNLIAYYGDALRLTFARSSMKPIQAVPVVESGAVERYRFTDKDIALFCASHSGEAFHIEGVREILHKMNVAEDQLQCGPHIPRDIDNYNNLIKTGGKLGSIYSNCSGKHSGMLAACLMHNFDMSTYRDVNSPYQQKIMDVIADVSDYNREKIATGIDGCGVPVHRIPLHQLALAFARLAKPNDWSDGSPQRRHALHSIRDAMMHHPEMVAGTNRFDTDLMAAYGNRIIAKGGAEGVHCFGDKETGIGVAVKVEDGNGRGTPVASMEVLKQLNIGDETIWHKLESHSNTPVLNTRNEIVGEVSAGFSLHFM